MNKKILAFVYDGKKFLTLRNNAKDPSHGGDFWFTVTGTIEEGESKEDAIQREVKEETGLIVKDIFDLNWGSIYNWGNRRYQEKNFIVFVKRNRVKLNEEHVGYRWLRLKRFVNLISWAGDKGMLKEILKQGIKKTYSPPLMQFEDYTSTTPKTVFTDGKNTITLSWHESEDFFKLKDIRQCYGICFNKKGKILIVKDKDKWSLPGGKPEKGETFEEALKRELDEEADVEVGNIIPIGYNKIEENKEGKKSVFYQLRYFAKIIKIKRQTVDPAINIIRKRKFIKPERFLFYCPWGKTGEAMIREAVQAYNK